MKRLGLLIFAVVLLIVLGMAGRSDISDAGAFAVPPLPNPYPAIVHAPCPEFPEAGGCSNDDTVWIAPGQGFDTRQHEFGHVIEKQQMTDDERNAFKILIGHSNWPWNVYTDGPEWYRSAAERFAEAYASCRAQWLPVEHRGIVWIEESRYEWFPKDNATQRTVCRLITYWLTN